MARFNILGSGGIDRRAQAQAADLQQQQLDQSQNDHLLNQALQFYGIGQSHAMDAERLKAMQANTAFDQARLQQEQQFTPERLRSMQLENSGREIANRSAGTSADWGPYSHDLASRQAEQQLSQQGQMFPEQLHGAQLANQRSQTAADWDPYNLGLASRHGEQTLAQQGQIFPSQLEGQNLSNQHSRISNASAQLAQDWSPYQLELGSRQGEQQLAQANALAPGQLAGQGIANAGAAQQVDQQRQLFPGQLMLQDLAGQSAQTHQNYLPYQLDFAARQGEQGLDQQAEAFPGQLRNQRLSNIHLGLENTGQGINNDWAPSQNEARYNATNAMADKNTGLNIHDAIVLRQMGYLNDEDLNKLMPPDIQHAHAAAAQAAEAQRQAAIAADQSQQNGPHAPSRSMYDSASTLGDNAANMLYDIPSSVYNAVHGAGDIVSGLLGGPQFNRLRPVSQIKAANRKGSDYGSVFYDPRDPNANTPLPTARSYKP